METCPSGDKLIRIDAHQPSGSGPFPALVLLHGSGGAVSYWLDRFAPLLAQAGYAVYAPHYFDKTGTQRATAQMVLDGKHFPLWLTAVKDVVNYIARTPPINPKRIGVVGISLGGYLATALAVDEPMIRAAVEVSGGIPPGWADKISPNTPPMLVLHGEKDDVVPASEARRLQVLLQSHGVPSTVEIFPGETHWFTHRAQLRMLLLCNQFLRAHL